MCCFDLETLFINYKPFYSPREICLFILVSFYINPQAHVSLALLNSTVTDCSGVIQVPGHHHLTGPEVGQSGQSLKNLLKLVALKFKLAQPNFFTVHNICFLFS